MSVAMLQNGRTMTLCRGGEPDSLHRCERRANIRAQSQREHTPFALWIIVIVTG